MKKRYVKPAIVLSLVVILGIAGSLAYLTDTTDVVTNQFTAGEDIDITLEETGTTADASGVLVNDGYTIIPGATESKDPHVIVADDSEKVYVYVDVIEDIGSGTGEDFSAYIDYAVSNDWVKVDTGTANASGTTTYVYTGGASDNNPVAVEAEEVLYILAGTTNTNGEVTYPTSITNAMLDAIDGVDGSGATDSDETVPTLSFVAYAVQAENLLATDANTAFNSYFKAAIE